MAVVKGLRGRGTVLQLKARTEEGGPRHIRHATDVKD